jgi:hypothetical protein
MVSEEGNLKIDTAETNGRETESPPLRQAVIQLRDFTTALDLAA